MKNQFKISVDSLLKHNKEGSFSTHANRSARLKQSMAQLSEKYTGMTDIRQLKPRHIEHLVERWKSDGLSSGTIKNRMTDLRWVAQKIGKADIVSRTNDDYDIDRRTYTSNDNNRAKILEDRDLDRITDPYVSRSLQLQAAFGLRREESIKFNPKYADQGGHIKLKDSWTKGGRPRTVPITNERQRELLNEIKEFCREQCATALISPEKNYSQQLKTYENQTERKGLNNNHGLRHQYAQDRYHELTGWKCPKQGGKLAKDMTESERLVDTKIRLQISSELGHNREEITNVYLGGKK